MSKQKQIEGSLRKVDEGILRCIAGEFPKTGELILDLLERRRDILEKTHRKIVRLNERNLINFTQ